MICEEEIKEGKRMETLLNQTSLAVARASSKDEKGDAATISLANLELPQHA